jgi:hypothetical protein
MTMVQEIEIIEVDIDGRTFWVRSVGYWRFAVWETNSTVVSGVATAIEP